MWLFSARWKSRSRWLRNGAPAFPAYIEGAFEALPRGRGMPKRRQISVTFGDPEPVEILRAADTGRTDE
jgi:hypothetical protein